MSNAKKRSNKKKNGLKLERNEKILLCIVFVVLAVFLYVQFILMPSITKITKLKEDIKAKNEEYKKYADIDQQIVDKQKKADELKDKYTDSLDVLPKSDGYPNISSSVEELVNKNSLKLKDAVFAPGKPYVETDNSQNNNQDKTNKDYTMATNPADVLKEKDSLNQKNTDSVDSNNKDLKNGLNVQNITLTVEGNFLNTLALVKDLEDSTRMCQVKSVQSQHIDEKVDTEIKLEDTKDKNNTNKQNNSKTNDKATKKKEEKEITVISAEFYYVPTSDSKEEYDFNDSKYGKENMFDKNH